MTALKKRDGIVHYVEADGAFVVWIWWGEKDGGRMAHGDDKFRFDF